MHTITPIEARRDLSNTPIHRYAVSRRCCKPLFEESETFLAMDHQEALEIADQLKEEVRESLGAFLGSRLPDRAFNIILAQCLNQVTITKVAVQPVLQ